MSSFFFSHLFRLISSFFSKITQNTRLLWRNELQSPLIITFTEAVTSGRDPKHLFEDAIEENGDEYVPHSEYYEGVDEFPLKACDGTAEETALVLAPVSKYHTMAVIPGQLESM